MNSKVFWIYNDFDFDIEGLDTNIVRESNFYDDYNIRYNNKLGGGHQTKIVYYIDEESRRYFNELYGPIMDCCLQGLKIYYKKSRLRHTEKAEAITEVIKKRQIQDFLNTHSNDTTSPCVSIIIARTDDYDHINGFNNDPDEDEYDHDSNEWQNIANDVVKGFNKPQERPKENIKTSLGPGETYVDVITLTLSDVNSLTSTSFGRRKRMLSEKKFIKMYMKLGNSKLKAQNKYRKACKFFM